MDLMELRRSLLDFDPPGTYCGIPIFIDNAKFSRENGQADDVVADADWFIAGWIDSGSTSKKTYTYFRTGVAGSAAWRVYNDMTGTSVDWWAASSPTGGDDTISTVSTSGQYILFSVYKPAAHKTYLKQDDTYLFKGKGV